MHPLRFWSLFFALSASATVLFPRIADARPQRDLSKPAHRPVARPVAKPVARTPIAKPVARTPIAKPVARTPIVKLGCPYIAEIHGHKSRQKGKRK